MRSRALLSLVFAASLPACFELDLDQRTEGNDGELRFGLVRGDVLSCLFGCPVEEPFAVGAVADVLIGETDPTAKISVRLADKKDGSVTLADRFVCGSETTESREVARGEKCQAGEELTAHRIASIVAVRAGTVTLEVLDADGDVLDSLDIETRAADTLVATSVDGVTFFPGAPTLPVSRESTQTFQLGLQASGEALYFNRFVGEVTSGAEDVATIGPPTAFLLGNVIGFDVVTGASGQTTVSVAVGETTFEMPVDLGPAE